MTGPTSSASSRLVVRDGMARRWYIVVAALFLSLCLGVAAWAIFDTGPGPGGSFRCTTESDPKAHC